VLRISASRGTVHGADERGAVPRELTAVLLAVVAALFIATGIVVRQHSTRHVHEDDAVGTGMARALVCQPLWWAGTAAAVGGFVFQALALGRGSLLLVQPVLVSSLLFALPLSARLVHRRVTGREWTWALLLSAAIAVFVLVGSPKPGRPRPPGPSWTVAAVAVLVVLAACLLGVRRSRGRVRAVRLAVAVAVLFGVVAVLTTICVRRLEHGGLVAVLTVPAPYALVAVALLGTVLQQSAFHAGALQTSVPTMIVLEPMVAVTLGVAVLGDHLSVGGPGVAVLVVAVLVMVGSTVALAVEAVSHEAVSEVVRV
jgi:drug/metabolite transporter (DMT)-like permease